MLGPEIQWSGQQQQEGGPWFLDVRIYAGADAAFDLYEDNGVDHAYEEPNGGEYKTTPLRWSDASRTLTVGEQQGTAAPVVGVPDQRTIRVFVVAPGHGVGIALDDGQVPDAEIAYNGTETAVVL